MQLLMIRSPTNHASSNSHIQQLFHSFASVCIKGHIHSNRRPSASISCSCQAKQGVSSNSIKPEGGYSGKPLTFLLQHIRSNMWKSKAALVLVKDDTTSALPEAMRKVKVLFYGNTPVEENTAPRIGTNTNTSTLFPLTDSQGSDREEKKWYWVVLTLIEWHKAKLYPVCSFFLNSTMMGVPGQCFGEIRIKNRIKLKVAQQQPTKQQKKKVGEEQKKGQCCCWIVLAAMLVSPGDSVNPQMDAESWY